MVDQSSYPPLRLLSQSDRHDLTEQSVEPSEPPVEPGPEPEGVLRRRYTVTVQPDGSELIDDVEEWHEDVP